MTWTIKQRVVFASVLVALAEVPIMGSFDPILNPNSSAIPSVAIGQNAGIQTHDCIAIGWTATAGCPGPGDVLVADGSGWSRWMQPQQKSLLELASEAVNLEIDREIIKSLVQKDDVKPHPEAKKDGGAVTIQGGASTHNGASGSIVITAGLPQNEEPAEDDTEPLEIVFEDEKEDDDDFFIPQAPGGEDAKVAKLSDISDKFEGTIVREDPVEKGEMGNGPFTYASERTPYYAVQPGEVVWHAVTGNGPYVTIRTTVIDLVLTNPRGRHERADDSFNEGLRTDGWIVKDRYGRYLTIPTPEISKSKPSRSLIMIIWAWWMYILSIRTIWKSGL
jgi:hypothetical protein